MATKKKTARKKTAGKAVKTNQAGMQIRAIITFFVGVLMLCMAFIPGENLWVVLHNVLFGLFGPIAYVVGAGLIYIGAYCAYHKKEQGIPLLLYILILAFGCGLWGLFALPALPGTDFLSNLQYIYECGVAKVGGGVFFSLMGWPLMHLFGKIAAIIVLCVCFIATVLIVSGKTLVEFLNTAAAPVKKTGQIVSKQVDTIVTGYQKNKKNIDISLGPDAKKDTAPIEVPKFDDTREKMASDIDIIFGERGKESEPVAEPAVEKEPAVAAPVRIKQEKKTPEPILKEGPVVEEKPDTEAEEVVGGKPKYKFPPLSLLDLPKNRGNTDISAELNANGEKLVDTLKSFGVSTKIINISRGPSVTRYELQPSVGVKISKITSLADDIALNLATTGVRIEAPIPNKAAVGIEVPNREASMVTIREILSSPEFINAKSGLTFALGKDIAGNVKVSDIAKMPHMLIAGATGSGKSVCINGIILSIIYKSSPEDVRMLMIDPKMVELGKYNGIPHLEIPVVTDPKKAASALNWAVSEMLNRYKLFAANNVRDLASYNKLAEGENELVKMPQMVIIIDELADLMMASPGEVEDAICRLAQMARAAGMHLIIATQRPSVDVITGVIKANIPSRLALAVSSQVDSRTILDGAGAEKLLGRGDMLFMPMDTNKPIRIQGCYANDTEIERVIEFIKPEVPMTYNEQVQAEIEKNAELIGLKGKKGAQAAAAAADNATADDDVLHQAVELAVDFGQISTSLLQRKLKLGYARASRIVDQMEEMGIVGPFEGSKPRQVLINRAQWMEMCMNGQDKTEE